MNTETAILTKRSDDTVTTTFPVDQQTANHNLVTGDIGKKLDFNTASAVSLNLLAAATAGDGFQAIVENIGDGDLTITPDGSETINDETSLEMASGESGLLICNGSAWQLLPLGDVWSKATPIVEEDTFIISKKQLGRLFLLSSSTTTKTVTLPSINKRRNGGTVFLRNINEKDWTITGAGNDEIDGAASVTLAKDESLILVFQNESGADDKWHSLGGSGGSSGGVTSISGGDGIEASASTGAVTISATSPEGAAAPNLLINGDFAVAQRGTAMTDVADSSYCLDRWYVLTETASIDVDQQTNQEDGQPTNIRLEQDQSTAQRMGIAQIVEGINCKSLRGQSVTLSARVRSSAASTDVRYAILEWTGTEDTVTSDVVNDWTSTIYTKNNFFINSADLTLTAVGEFTTDATASTWGEITPLAGSLGSTFNNVIVFLWTEGAAAQNVTLDIGLVKLEPGETATEFVPRPIGEELALCQRYFVRYINESALVNLLMASGTIDTTQNFFPIYHLPVELRDDPIFSAENLTGIRVRYKGANLAITGIEMGTSGRQSGSLNVINTGATFTAGDAGNLALTDGGTLNFSAEL